MEGRRGPRAATLSHPAALGLQALSEPNSEKSKNLRGCRRETASSIYASRCSGN